MKKISLVLFLLAGLFLSAHAQKTMLKTNIPYWLTASPNLGAEFAVADNVSIELSAGFNPFKFGSDKQLKHWVIWPEARYWLNETYNGHFFGFHGVGGQFDMGRGGYSHMGTGKFERSSLRRICHWFWHQLWVSVDIEFSLGIGGDVRDRLCPIRLRYLFSGRRSKNRRKQERLFRSFQRRDIHYLCH